MKIVRQIVEGTTRVFCKLKRHQRIVPPGGLDRINLGCGLAVAKRWVNIDGSLSAFFAAFPPFVHKIIYRASGANRYYSCEEYCSLLKNHIFVHHDLAYGIPIRNDAVNFVYSSHFLEHLFLDEALQLLRESFRVLKAGGVIRVCVPDLAFAISLYESGEKEKMLSSYFFVEDKGSSFSRHKYMYDFELLKAKMEEVGFKDVILCTFQNGKTPDLEILDNREEDTLYVEGVK